MDQQLLVEVTLKGLRAKSKLAKSSYLAAAQLLALGLESAAGSATLSIEDYLKSSRSSHKETR